MAITASSFRRGTSGGAASFKGMRRFSPKDTTTLLKTVDAINKNLVSINKLLQQQNALTVKKQQTEQREKRIQRESAAKERAEAAIESTKSVGKNILRGLKDTAKKITGGIFSFLKPFIKFFTVVFIGWFSKGVIKWFQQDAETKKKQLKEWVPKILKTLAVIGGVIAALQFGLPLLLTALGTLISTLPIVFGALLNPITWKVLLAAGAGIGLTELFERGAENFNPGQRARERVRKVLQQEQYKGAFDYGEKISVASGLQAERASGVSVPSSMDQYVKIGDKIYKAEDIDRLLRSPTKFDEDLKTYEKQGAGVKETGSERVNAEAIREQKALAGLVGDQRKEVLTQLAQNRISSAYKEYFRAKKAIEDQDAKIKQREELPYTPVGPNDPGKEAILEKMREKRSRLENDLKYARNTVSTMYNTLTDEQRSLLGNKLGITADQLFPESLTEAQTAYAMRGALNYVGDMVETPLKNVVSQMENFKAGVNQQFNSLVDTVSDFEFNFNINPVAAEDDDDPNSIPPSGVGISPFDMENAFLQFAKQNYVLLGVL